MVFSLGGPANLSDRFSNAGISWIRFDADIIIGSVLGTLMLLNVWGIIWRNRR